MSTSYRIPLPAHQVSVLDSSGYLNRLHQGVQGDNASADDQKKVAQQFEALFIQQLLKQARQSSGIQGLFESDQTRLAQSLADEQVATQLADPGIGLARALLEQIQGSHGGKGEPGSNAPELASSSIDGERSNVATSISDLIDMLGKSPVGQATGAVFAAIKGAPQHIESFVAKMTHAAKIASAESGVPAKLILSQAALESGWGKREIKGEDGSSSYNLFGIKASPGWKGKVVNIMTTEYENGVAQKVMQPFRAYNSYAESFADYARLISKNQRYSEVVGAPSAEVAAQRIQEAGYATDPNYAKKLISIMSYFDARKT